MTSRRAAADDPRPAPGPVSTRTDELTTSQQVLAQLQQKIESLPTIEQAKGILMARFSLDAETAFTLLVRWSQATNVKLRAISASLVEAAGTPGALDTLIDALQQGASSGGGTAPRGPRGEAR